jgi:hypothetical protein
MYILMNWIAGFGPGGRRPLGSSWTGQGNNFVMKVVLLAGGYGTRLSEETDLRPKPMVEIGGRPVL